MMNTPSILNKESNSETKEGDVIAIIPARGGSKGIPLKNLRQVGLRSLISYTIEEALLAEKIDRVIVSTDSERIAEEGKKRGAEVPFLRPDELSDDKAPLAAVMRHFLDWAKEQKWKIKALVILEPTSPLRTSKEIDEAVELFRVKEVETVVSVEKDTSLWWEEEDGQAREMQKERVNRQFLKPKYKENGAIFVTNPEVVTSSTTIGKKVALYEMSTEKSIDINSYWDMRLADLLLRSVKIVFHFKATALLGFGHFYRVLALANRLYSNEIVLVCSDYDEGLKERIGTIGFKYILTKEPLEVIKNEKPTIVINDI
ncbi:MAG: hypothetical protein KAS04_04355, partial [Candidatus Aenigmarchaeota archaeon]|nr:hypothetical protein [Candidatus Aenigmarchaeota archaeon]